MKRQVTRTTLVALLAYAAAGPLLAQVPEGMPQQPAMQPYAPPKKTSLQVSGAMTIPVFSYAEFLDDIGWQAQGAFIVRRGPYMHLRIEGEYNSTAYESDLSGGAEVYGGGIGGGRVVSSGNMQTEGYGVIGLYQHEVSTCVGNVCGDAGELQFGLKVGTNVVVGRGKVRPVLDFHWLTTFSTPYVNLIAIGAGLRF